MDVVPASVKVYFPDCQPTWPKTLKPGTPISNLDQVSILVEDIDAAIEYFGAAFGWGPFYIVEYQDKAGQHLDLGAYHLKIAFVQVGPIEVELLQLLSGDTPHRRHLQLRGEGLYHLRLSSRTLDEDLAHLKSVGIKAIWDLWIAGTMTGAETDSDKRFGVRFELVRDAAQVMELLASRKS
jgi:hypothetical protein